MCIFLNSKLFSRFRERRFFSSPTLEPACDKQGVKTAKDSES